MQAAATLNSRDPKSSVGLIGPMDEAINGDGSRIEA